MEDIPIPIEIGFIESKVNDKSVPIFERAVLKLMLAELNKIKDCDLTPMLLYYQESGRYIATSAEALEKNYH